MADRESAHLSRAALIRARTIARERDDPAQFDYAATDAFLKGVRSQRSGIAFLTPDS
jgi:hypothetical protein